MYLNPNNPHHGVDCICDSCSRYWHTFGQRMAETLARQRSAQQSIDGCGEGSDPTSEQSGDQEEAHASDSLATQGVDEGKRDSDPDPQEGNPLVSLSGCGMIHIKSNEVEWAPQEKIGRLDYEIKNVEGVYQVVDVQGFVVCECSKRHNAGLICHLLNQHT